MHIPDLMLQGAICPATAGIAGACLAGTAYAAYKTKDKPALSFFAGVTALVFAAQMADFPIPLGTSGHLLGATLAVALLGSAFGILAMSTVVITQCLVFADGGLTVLGANLLNMAIISAIPAIIVREFFSQVKFKHTAYFTAAFAGTLLAVSSCAVQLAIGGAVAYPLQEVLWAMLSAHLLLGLAEGGLTVALLVLLSYAGARVLPRRAWLVPVSVAVAIAVISPLTLYLAGDLPSGLELVTSQFGG